MNLILIIYSTLQYEEFSYIIDIHVINIKFLKCLYFFFILSLWNPVCSLYLQHIQFKLDTFLVFNGHIRLWFLVLGQQKYLKLNIHFPVPSSGTYSSMWSIFPFWKSLTEQVHDETVRAWTITGKYELIGRENFISGTSLNLFWTTILT